MIIFEGCQKVPRQKYLPYKLEVTLESEFCKDPWFKWLSNYLIWAGNILAGNSIQFSVNVLNVYDVQGIVLYFRNTEKNKASFLRSLWFGSGF